MDSTGQSSGDVSKLSTTQLSQLLGSHVRLNQESGNWQGRVCIHIDAQQQYRILTSDEDIQTHGLSQRNLAAIVQISMAAIRTASRPEQMQLMELTDNIVQFMAALAKQEAPQGNVAHAVRNVFAPQEAHQEENVEHELPDLTSSVRSVVVRLPIAEVADVRRMRENAAQGNVSAQRLTAISTCLRSDPTVSRSLNGRNGVFFVRAAGQEKLVMKFCTEPEKHMLADQVLRNFFPVPDYQEVPRESEAGRLAVAVLSEKGKQSYQVQISKARPEDVLLMEGRLKQMDWVCSQRLVVAKLMPATAFSNLELHKCGALMQNADFQNQMGKMFLADVLIHNSDRLTENECNLANFMVTSEEDGPVKLVSIDHDYALTSEVEAEVCRNLTNLLTGRGIEERLQQLQRHNMLDAQADITAMIPAIRHGVMDAASQFLETFARNQQYRDSVQIDFTDSVARPDHAVLERVLAFLEQSIGIT